MENGRKSLSLLRQNIKTLAPENARILQRDARRLGTGEQHDLVFLDPPYGSPVGEAALRELAKAGWLSDTALVIWEDEAPHDAPDGFRVEETRSFGGTHMTFLRSEQV